MKLSLVAPPPSPSSLLLKRKCTRLTSALFLLRSNAERKLHFPQDKKKKPQKVLMRKVLAPLFATVLSERQI